MKPTMYHGFEKVNKILPGKIKQYKLEKSFYKRQAIKHWHGAACKYIDKAHESTQALDLKNGVLTIACLSKEIAYQIKLLAQRIMYEINKLKSDA